MKTLRVTLPWSASVVKYLHLREVDAIIVQFELAFGDRP